MVKIRQEESDIQLLAGLLLIIQLGDLHFLLLGSVVIIWQEEFKIQLGWVSAVSAASQLIFLAELTKFKAIASVLAML